MAFDTEDLARTVLVRILPRGRYRIAAPNDSRFSTFAPQAVRVAFRQQGAQPSLVLFVGPDQDPRASGLAAAEWAAANWRPNAVQKRVRPGVVAVQVGPAAQLAAPGPVAGAPVPAVVWTVDADTGRCLTPGSAPGAPPSGEIGRAASALARGLPPPALGEIDLAERELMHPQSRSMAPAFTGGLAILLLLFGARFGFSALGGALSYGRLLNSGGSVSVNPQIAAAGLVLNLLLLAGIVFGLALLLNFRGAAMRVPGFSSATARTRTASWAAYVVAMLAVTGATTYGLPQALRSAQDQTNQPRSMQLVTESDDGAQAEVPVGNSIEVNLTAWPRAEWAGMRFSTSNPTVLQLISAGRPSLPVAAYVARSTGAARIDAESADGRYTFELRVVVGAS